MMLKKFFGDTNMSNNPSNRMTSRNGSALPQARYGVCRRSLLGCAVIMSMLLCLWGCAVPSEKEQEPLSAPEQTAQVSETAMTESVPIETAASVPEETGDFVPPWLLDNVNYLALQEWNAFLDTYDADRSLRKANNNNASGVPADYYYVYDCYTWDMVTKLDDLLAQFDLELLTNLTVVQSDESPSLLDQLTLAGILRENAEADITNPSGYFYREGTFSISTLVTLTGQDALWTKPILTTYRYCAKDYFDPAFPQLENLRNSLCWPYTLSDGTEVLLALSEERAVILCDQENAVICVEMDLYDRSETMNQETLEQIAEIFDFGIVPVPCPSTATETNTAPQEGPSDGKLRFGDYITRYLDTSNYPNEPLYAFADLSGDHSPELVIKTVNEDGTTYLDIFSKKNGSVFQLNVIPVNYICQGNVLEEYSNIDGEEKHSYYLVSSGGLARIDFVQFDPDTQKWARSQDSSWGAVATEISESEAKAVISNYSRIELEMQPCSQFHEVD